MGALLSLNCAHAARVVSSPSPLRGPGDDPGRIVRNRERKGRNGK